MTDVQFEEEQQYQRYGQTEQKPFLIRLVLATHIVSTDNSAKYVLICVAILAIVLSFLVFSLSSASSPEAPSGTNVINISGEPPRLIEPMPVR